MYGVGVCGAKSYCAQSVQVCQNWLYTNTLETTQHQNNVRHSFFKHIYISDIKGSIGVHVNILKSFVPTESRLKPFNFIRLTLGFECLNVQTPNV